MTSETRPSVLDRDRIRRLRAHLDSLYPPQDAADAHERLVAMLQAFVDRCGALPAPGALFDQTDVVLITYADQITAPDEPPLQTLHEFLRRHVHSAISGVHLLPFYPATSDDGFSVADYRSVDPAFGTWQHVAVLARDFKLMVDAVFNHVSASSPWFRKWAAGDNAFERFFLSVDPSTDLSAVTRPRSSPLLTAIDGANGLRYVWTTFSDDQVDLNFSDTGVLLAVTEALLDYIGYGARMIRLDAVAFLWKAIGTACIHLPQTHEIVRLWRTIIDIVAPGTLLITETNVPHEENVSYFGSGDDEAHMVYQFPLAPLVLSSFHLADATVLSEWASGLSTPSDQTTFFNFLGSHDGIGLRPAEGLLTPSEINQLCNLAKAHGAGVSLRATPDGRLAPYEINSVFFDALTEADSHEPLDTQIDRFLSAQSILLALAGVPGIYVQALLGSRNWHEGVRHSGRLRTINREKFQRDELEAALADPRTQRAKVLARLRERITVRIGEPAFHPNGPQRIIQGNQALFAVERTAPDGSSGVLCVHNVSGRAQPFSAAVGEAFNSGGNLVDLCSGRPYRVSGTQLELTVPPYGVLWLRPV